MQRAVCVRVCVRVCLCLRAAAVRVTRRSQARPGRAGQAGQDRTGQGRAEGSGRANGWGERTLVRCRLSNQRQEPLVQDMYGRLCGRDVWAIGAALRVREQRPLDASVTDWHVGLW